jgi:hypothetical protein
MDKVQKPSASEIVVQLGLKPQGFCDTYTVRYSVDIIPFLEPILEDLMHPDCGILAYGIVYGRCHN